MKLLRIGFIAALAQSLGQYSALEHRRGVGAAAVDLAVGGEVVINGGP